MKVAVLGASGFVGTRLLERFVLLNLAEVRPIVRRIGSLARVCRFKLDPRLADACDEAALTEALRGCEVLVHSMSGDARVITGTVGPSYRAAKRAGIRRIVYLSSAVVHGLTPPPGVLESSPIDESQAFPYNNAKAKSERMFARLRAQGGPEIVVLRPSIVIGPRSRWIDGTAREMLDGQAYLIEGGAAVCNTVYVDNLVEAIRLSLDAPGVDGEAFFVGDDEAVSWRMLYQALAQPLGIDVATLPHLDAPHYERNRMREIYYELSPRARLALGPLLPRGLKDFGKAAVGMFGKKREMREATAVAPGPQVTREMGELMQCRVRFPWDKAKERLGYRPIVSFAEGCRRSVEWLRFAGFPLAER